VSKENPFEETPNEDLLNKLEDAENFARLLDSPEWAVFREAWKRIHDEADRKLNMIDPTDTAGIIQCQLAKRFYKNVLETTIRQMHEVADLAYHEAKERGLINRFVEKVRARLSLNSRAHS
jgi:hypothetical protein